MHTKVTRNEPKVTVQSGHENGGWRADATGQRIRARREQLGITQAQLAEVLERYGSSDATPINVSRRERGTRRLTLDALLVYALALYCSPLDLLGDEDTEIQVTSWTSWDPRVTRPPARRSRKTRAPKPMTFLVMNGREIRAWFAGVYHPGPAVPWRRD